MSHGRIFVVKLSGPVYDPAEQRAAVLNVLAGRAMTSRKVAKALRRCNTTCALFDSEAPSYYREADKLITCVENTDGLTRRVAKGKTVWSRVV